MDQKGGRTFIRGSGVDIRFNFGNVAIHSASGHYGYGISDSLFV